MVHIFITYSFFYEKELELMCHFNFYARNIMYCEKYKLFINLFLYLVFGCGLFF